MSQGDEFELQGEATTNAEREQGAEGRQKREHADDGMTAAPETLCFPGFWEFSARTGNLKRYIPQNMVSLFDSILSLQRQLQGALAGHAVALFDSPAYLASGLAIAVGIGLVHALTPGHGKAVIFSYFLGHSAGLLASLRVALVAAITHGSVAVLLVLTAGRVLSQLGRPTGAAAWLEIIAGVIVTAMGAIYVERALRHLWRPHNPGTQPEVSRPMLAIAMGLLPCPLTIIVVGAAVN